MIRLFKQEYTYFAILHPELLLRVVFRDFRTKRIRGKNEYLVGNTKFILYSFYILWVALNR